MQHRFIPILLAALGLSTAAFSAEQAPSTGIVNFGSCVSDSKLGKQEQASFESLKKQMASLLEDTEKQLVEITTKLKDPEYIDGLSPEAEESLSNRRDTLNEEYARYQNQYYQVMSQANMRIVQTLSAGINQAAEKVAKEKKLTMVLNKDACFYYSPDRDITNLIVAEMDKDFNQNAKKTTVDNSAEALQQTEAKK